MSKTDSGGNTYTLQVTQNRHNYSSNGVMYALRIALIHSILSVSLMPIFGQKVGR